MPSPPCSDRNLADFHPLVSGWFAARYGEPTEPQVRGWPLIRAGRDVFDRRAHRFRKNTFGRLLLGCLRRFVFAARQKIVCRISTLVVYVSPLKALTNDVQKMLEVPLGELLRDAQASGIQLSPIRTAVRTGDTAASERQRMLRKPPHVLVTTPESLFILLTAEKSRASLFSSVSTVTRGRNSRGRVGDKRGAITRLTLARLDDLAQRESGRKPQRIGLPSRRSRSMSDVVAESIESRCGNRACGESWREPLLSVCVPRKMNSAPWRATRCGATCTIAWRIWRANIAPRSFSFPPGA